MTATGRCGGLTQREADPDTAVLPVATPHHPRHCPRCRLPRPPAAAHHVALHGGQSAIVGLCASCEQAIARLPSTTRRKAIERAVNRAVADPGRHWCSVFEDRNAADLNCALLGVREVADEALQALGWIE